MIKVCFIGCGSIARLHLKALQAIKCTSSVKIAGLVDPNHESAVSLSKQLHDPPQIFSSIDDMNQSLCYDAAVVMTPHDTHVECARKCIEAGKHVLLEKPVSTTIAGCLELKKLAESSDKVIMIAENSRFWPEVVYAKELIQEGTIGEVYYGHANYWESIGRGSFNEEGVPQWTKDPKRAGGGVLMDGTVHWTRSLRVLLGDIQEVIGFTAKPWADHNGETLSHSLLRFTNGLPGVLHAQLIDTPMTKIPYFQIFGSKGEINIHGDFDGGITVYTKDCPEGKVTKSLGGYWASFKPQMEEFISRVTKGSPLSENDGGSIQQGTKDILVSMAIYRSVETKKWESTTIDHYAKI